MRYLSIIKKNKLKCSVFSLLLIAFILLLYKDPFSLRTLIPNLEPFPDTIHYLNSSQSLAKGYGFQIVREGISLNPSVPPLYSVLLIPIFLINDDPRLFYYINFVLSIVSFGLFILVLRKITHNLILIFTVCFFYITNYFIYWYPNLPMAENLILPLFLGAVLLLISKVTLKNTILIGIIAVAFYATKYASLPLTLSVIFLYLLKIYIDEKNKKEAVKKISRLFISLICSFIFFYLFEYYSKGVNPIANIFNFFSILVQKSTPGTNLTTENPWFSMMYMQKNLPIYLSIFIGKPVRFLWDFTPMVPNYIGIIGVGGLILGILKRKTRFISFSLMVLLFSSILFMSTFYAVDARYIYHAIPTLLIGVCLFFVVFMSYIDGNNQSYKLNSILKWLSGNLKIKGRYIIYILLTALFLSYLSTNIMKFKSQVMINLKYAETPWNYIAVIEINKYFSSENNILEKKPIVISAQPPYYIDFYSNGHYKLLPLSINQEFWSQRENVWGKNDYSDLIRLYKHYIEQGYDLYVTNYGLGNADYLYSDFDKIKNAFVLKEVVNACHNTCNLYKLELHSPGE